MSKKELLHIILPSSEIITERFHCFKIHTPDDFFLSLRNSLHKPIQNAPLEHLTHDECQTALDTYVIPFVTVIKLSRLKELESMLSSDCQIKVLSDFTQPDDHVEENIDKIRETIKIEKNPNDKDQSSNSSDKSSHQDNNFLSPLNLKKSVEKRQIEVTDIQQDINYNIEEKTQMIDEIKSIEKEESSINIEINELINLKEEQNNKQTFRIESLEDIYYSDDAVNHNIAVILEHLRDTIIAPTTSYNHYVITSTSEHIEIVNNIIEHRKLEKNNKKFLDIQKWMRKQANSNSSLIAVDNYDNLEKIINQLKILKFEDNELSKIASNIHLFVKNTDNLNLLTGFTQSLEYKTKMVNFTEIKSMIEEIAKLDNLEKETSLKDLSKKFNLDVKVIKSLEDQQVANLQKQIQKDNGLNRIDLSKIQEMMDIDVQKAMNQLINNNEMIKLYEDLTIEIKKLKGENNNLDKKYCNKQMIEDIENLFKIQNKLKIDKEDQYKMIQEIENKINDLMRAKNELSYEIGLDKTKLEQLVENYNDKNNTKENNNKKDIDQVEDVIKVNDELIDIKEKENTNKLKLVMIYNRNQIFICRTDSQRALNAFKNSTYSITENNNSVYYSNSTKAQEFAFQFSVYNPNAQLSKQNRNNKSESLTYGLSNMLFKLAKDAITNFESLVQNGITMKKLIFGEYCDQESIFYSRSFVNSIISTRKSQEWFSNIARLNTSQSAYVIFPGMQEIGPAEKYLARGGQWQTKNIDSESGKQMRFLGTVNVPTDQINLVFIVHQKQAELSTQSLANEIVSMQNNMTHVLVNLQDAPKTKSLNEIMSIIQAYMPNQYQKIKGKQLNKKQWQNGEQSTMLEIFDRFQIFLSYIISGKETNQNPEIAKYQQQLNKNTQQNNNLINDMKTAFSKTEQVITKNENKRLTQDKEITEMKAISNTNTDEWARFINKFHIEKFTAINSFTGLRTYISNIWKTKSYTDDITMNPMITNIVEQLLSKPDEEQVADLKSKIGDVLIKHAQAEMREYTSNF